jgi:AcrR family transcriptional regulator
VPKIVDHDERREDVAEAAWRVIGRDGLEGATLREISREAGFTTGVIQHYFRDRDELLAFVARQISEQAFERMTRAIETCAPGKACLRQLLEVLVPNDLRTARVSALMSFWARSAIDPVHNAIQARQYETIRKVFRGQVQAAIEQGEISARRSADDLADHLLAFGDGLCVRSGMEPERFPRERRSAMLDAALADL